MLVENPEIPENNAFSVEYPDTMHSLSSKPRRWVTLTLCFYAGKCSKFWETFEIFKISTFSNEYSGVTVRDIDINPCACES